MKTNADNIETPRRYRNARSDASINTIQKTVEDKFGLPEGSIKIINPNGRKTRSDATVGTLKKIGIKLNHKIAFIGSVIAFLY